MHPEDRVLVGVIKRKKDFKIALEQKWYRVPQLQAPKGIYMEYLALFFGGQAFGDLNGGIHYYARRTGHELATRLELLPDEPNHKNAHERYYKIQFRELQAKVPPILNTHKRRFAFIYTTWDRFTSAKEIDDLYSRADHLVDRVFYVLKDAGYRPQRTWELAATQEYPAQTPTVRVLCENGEVVASVYGEEGISIEDSLENTVQKIKQEIEKQGGPIMLSTPLD
jgi:hypothetical protein